MLAAIGLGVALFVATNLDDLFLLLAFLAEPGARVRDVTLGQLTGIGALVVASALTALLSIAFAPPALGLLGLLPIGLGLQRMFAGGDDDDDAPPRAASGVLAIAAVTIANGGDNLAAYVPVFATRDPVALAVVVLTFVAMTFVWIAIARWLVAHPATGPVLRRFAGPAMPWVVVLLGVYVLWDAGTLAWLRA
jgi:cadmium resistance protein CadD (predicted permease)